MSISFILSLVIIIIALIGSIAASIYFEKKYFGKWIFESTHLAICYHHLSIYFIAIYRVFCSVIIVVVLVIQITAEGTVSFYYFKVWNWTLLGIYFLIVSVYSCKDIYFGLESSERGDIVGLFGKIVVVLYQIAITNAFLMTILTWSVLMPLALIEKDADATNSLFTIFSYFQHGGNILMIIIELFLNRLPYPISNVTYIICWPILYIIFVWISEGLIGLWPYEFMDTSQTLAPVWYLSLLLITILCFFSAFGFHFIKQKKFTLYEDAMIESTMLPDVL